MALTRDERTVLTLIQKGKTVPGMVYPVPIAKEDLSDAKRVVARELVWRGLAEPSGAQCERLTLTMYGKAVLSK